MPLSHVFSKAEDVYQLKNRAIHLVAAQKVGLEVTIYIIMIQTGSFFNCLTPLVDFNQQFTVPTRTYNLGPNPARN